MPHKPTDYFSISMPPRMAEKKDLGDVGRDDQMPERNNDLVSQVASRIIERNKSALLGNAGKKRARSHLNKKLEELLGGGGS